MEVARTDSVFLAEDVFEASLPPGTLHRAFNDDANLVRLVLLLVRSSFTVPLKHVPYRYLRWVDSHLTL